MKIRVQCLQLFLVFFTALPIFAETLVTFKTNLGDMELELYDQDKPVTVANFLQYVTSGRFHDQFIQRWEPNFVVQAGGYVVTNAGTNLTLKTIPTFGTITNEYSVGQRYSNTYGTIAMARQSKGTNSATSQWFLNLTNNAFLDNVDGGFTVFGKVISGTNILNLFVPQPPTNEIYTYQVLDSFGQVVPALATVPVLKPSPSFSDLIYVNVKLRKAIVPLDLSVRSLRPGQRFVGWTTAVGATNSLEYGSSLTDGTWTTLTNVVGTGSTFSVVDSSADAARVYRVRLLY